MKKIIMLVGLACGALVSDAINVTLDLTPPQSAWELRRKRTEEMRKALRIDEAKREALRYERRKRILNKAAEDLRQLSNASNKIVRLNLILRLEMLRLCMRMPKVGNISICNASSRPRKRFRAKPK